MAPGPSSKIRTSLPTWVSSTQRVSIVCLFICRCLDGILHVSCHLSSKVGGHLRWQISQGFLLFTSLFTFTESFQKVNSIAFFLPFAFLCIPWTRTPPEGSKVTTEVSAGCKIVEQRDSSPLLNRTDLMEEGGGVITSISFYKDAISIPLPSLLETSEPPRSSALLINSVLDRYAKPISMLLMVIASIMLLMLSIHDLFWAKDKSTDNA